MKRSWEDFLNPEVVRPRLLCASVYITGYEILKESIVGHIRGFFCFGFGEKGEIIDPKYQADVLARNRSPVYASLDWLKESGAINQADLEAFERLRACRNHLAHGLLNVLGKDGLPENFVDCFREMSALLRKIELSWISNVEIPTSPDFDGAEIDYEGIVPGPILTLKLLCDIALGTEEESRAYFEEFKKRLGNSGVPNDQGMHPTAQNPGGG